jgi:hypothetical protein
VNRRGTRFALAAAVGLVTSACVFPGLSLARGVVRPLFSDWEGSGPHGIGLSFEFVRRGRRAVASDFALGLPTGCRTRGMEAWQAGAIRAVEYIAPGSVLHGPFPPLGARQFEFILPGSASRPFPVIMEGHFSSRSAGNVSLPSPFSSRCHGKGWPATLRFRLRAAHRLPVSDGVWTGAVAGPPAGTDGAVRIRVIDGGRIETDFSASYVCPPPNNSPGGVELGPLPTEGVLIAANGLLGGAPGTETMFRARFAAHGTLHGTFAASGCGTPLIHPTFRARAPGRSRKSQSQIRSGPGVCGENRSGHYFSTANRRQAAGIPFSWCSPRSVRV